MPDPHRVTALRALAAKTQDPTVIAQVDNAIDALPLEDKVRVLTYVINNLRKGRHNDLAVALGELAHSERPDNPFLLAALATALSQARRSQQVITLVSRFLERVPPESLTKQDLMHLNISLSSGYRGIGDTKKAIEILEAVPERSPNVDRTLIELYCNVGRYADAIRLAQAQESLDWLSVKWYAKALFATGQRDEALKATESFKDHPQIQQTRQEFQQSDPALATGPTRRRPGKKVFVVHGHDSEVKEATARFLEKIGLHPIILHEQPSKNQTVIEKLERYANEVEFAVVLLTPDDVGTASHEPTTLRPRARQNVIMELGYFMGRLGRLNVCVLHKGGIELPSDYHGVIYVEIDAANAWKTKLAQELVDADLPVELKGLLGA